VRQGARAGLDGGDARDLAGAGFGARDRRRQDGGEPVDAAVAAAKAPALPMPATIRTSIVTDPVTVRALRERVILAVYKETAGEFFDRDIAKSEADWLIFYINGG
jgi:hypothetical protein